jgi:hypothetical protein
MCIRPECALDHEFFGRLFDENREILWNSFQNPEPEIFLIFERSRGGSEILKIEGFFSFCWFLKFFETYNRRFSTK